MTTFNDIIYLYTLSSGFDIQGNEESRPGQVCFLCASGLMPGKEQNRESSDFIISQPRYRSRIFHLLDI